MNVSAEQVTLLRLRSQGLTRNQGLARETPAQVLRAVVAVQAQEAPAAALSLWARGEGFTAADVKAALESERALVRTWLLRGTLHLAAAEDLGWLLPLLGPRFIRKSKRRYAQLGLDEAVLRRSLSAIREVLTGSDPLTRAELAERLAERGLPTEGQAAYHLLHHAGLSGLLCYGPDRDGEETYVLLEEWAPIEGSLTEGEALERLARRYLRAYAPTGPEDLAGWSGLTLTQARSAFAALEGELIEVELGGEPLWLLQEQAPCLESEHFDGVNLRLLPRYDTYWLGYRDRELSAPEEHARKIHPGGGILHPALLVNGLAAGTWTTTRRRDQLQLIVEPFASLGDAVLSRLEAESRNLGRFLETEVGLEVVGR